MKFISLIILLFIGIITLKLAYNTATYRPIITSKVDFGNKYKFLEDNPNFETSLNNFKEFLKLKTISKAKTKHIYALEFNKFNSHVKKNYPNTFKYGLVKKLNDSYLFKYPSGSATKKKPILLMAHYDVVGIENTEHWDEPPFSANTKNGYVYGRGAVDNKSSVHSILEAFETLYVNKISLSRDIYFSLGADEEIGGKNGALEISNYLKKENISFFGIYDEGGLITSGKNIGIKQNVAFVGLAEKGYLDLTIEVKSKGGHSSMPPDKNAIEILSEAIFEFKNHSWEKSINTPVKSMFEQASCCIPWYKKIVFRNTWLFSPILKIILNSKDQTRAMVETTRTVTMISSGTQRNVLPSKATANINLRLHTGEQVERVIQRVKLFFKDYGVDVYIPKDGVSISPSIESTLENRAGLALVKAIISTNVVERVLPLYTMAATDSRHFSGLGPIYRFSHVTLDSSEIKSIHGANERIKLIDLESMQKFYLNLILASDNSK